MIHLCSGMNLGRPGWWRPGALAQKIAEIRRRIPKDKEMRAFVHGAMCISYSGRCLLSNYFTGRDANLGECTHSCRWKYYLMEEKAGTVPSH